MNTKKLQLYFFYSCPYCQIVLDNIKENKLETRIEMLDIKKDPSLKNKLITDNGRTTVPCLYIDGVPMHESKDISRWLDQYAKSLEA